MIIGTIDRIRRSLSGDFYVVGGWAYCKESERIENVEIELSPNSEIDVNKICRGDLPAIDDIGFEFDATPADLAALLIGALKVTARHSDHVETLSIWKPCRQKIKIFLLEDLVFLDNEPEVISHAINNASSRVTGKVPPSQIERPVEMLVSYGAQSLAGDVIAGNNGRLYLYRGSNNLQEQYKEHDGYKATAKKWVDIILERARFSKQIDAKFFQIIIPEKQSIEGECYPNAPQGNTPLLKEMSSTLSCYPFYIDFTADYKKLFSAGSLPFRSVDSHLAIDGLTTVLSEITDRLGCPIKYRSNRVSLRLRSGDLGGKFFMKGDFVENVVIPSPDYIEGAEREPTLVAQKDVPGHIGLERAWVNEEAPIGLSVTVFGNSFFERGADPLCISYWFARLFRSVHFIWTPALDIDVALNDKADLIICQTIERFLPHVPDR